MPRTVCRGSFTGNGGGLSNVNASTFDGLASSSFWKLDGNNVSPGQVLGSTNNQALEFVVNGFTALRLEPNAMALPNLIGGRNNTIATGVYAATIGGGFANGIQTNANDAVIAGGSFNNIGPGSMSAAIGGGANNKIQTNSSFCTIAGGEAQIIGNNSVHSFIGGGLQNNIQTSTTFSTIGGGNTNSILTGASYANIGGGTKNTLGAATAATIAGGEANTIQAGADRSAIGGGSQNSTTGANGTVPGGFGNTAASYAFAAGRRAKANHFGSFVWADTIDTDFASTVDNQILIRASGRGGYRHRFSSNPAMS